MANSELKIHLQGFQYILDTIAKIEAGELPNEPRDWWLSQEHDARNAMKRLQVEVSKPRTTNSNKIMCNVSELGIIKKAIRLKSSYKDLTESELHTLIYVFQLAQVKLADGPQVEPRKEIADRLDFLFLNHALIYSKEELKQVPEMCEKHRDHLGVPRSTDARSPLEWARSIIQEDLARRNA